MKGLPFHFTGLETLKIKETDRIAALQNELGKFGAELTEPQHGDLAWDGTIKEELKQEVISIKTYKDHRMALAFAPAAMFHPNLIIEEPMVVTKSYPKYWEDLEMLGYTCEIEE